MVKKYKEFVEEGLLRHYNRWHNGEKRKENGIKVNTEYGEMYLDIAGNDYNDLISRLFDFECVYVYSTHFISNEERVNVMNYKCELDFPLEDLSHGGLCINFAKYEEVNEDVFEEDGEYSEHDYLEICKVFSIWLRDNVKFSGIKGKPGEYNLLLYSGDDFNEIDGDDYDYYKDSFEEDYNVDLNTWSYSYEINMGVDVTFENIKKYSEMKKTIDSYVKQINEDNDD